MYNKTSTTNQTYSMYNMHLYKIAFNTEYKNQGKQKESAHPRRKSYLDNPTYIPKTSISNDDQKNFDSLAQSNRHFWKSCWCLRTVLNVTEITTLHSMIENNSKFYLKDGSMVQGPVLIDLCCWSSIVSAHHIARS